ncbi:MAG: membrane protein insertion efficiency factor YidD [Proteobacteria bacterium]|nr:membrane protein insertion efficiency factor YidD [Pseudomonadota bacterium]
MKIVFEFYRSWISPFFHAFTKILSGNPHLGCKFVPTCSVYAEQAILTHGFWKGGGKAVLRICRCHPFSGRGGFDPV